MIAFLSCQVLEISVQKLNIQHRISSLHSFITLEEPFS